MKNLKKTITYVIEMALIIIITIGVFRFVVIPVKIEGVSMENTLFDQNIALINAIGVHKDNIKRFDVAVIYSKELDEKIIKRVIGLPGETIRYKNDVLYVNNELVEQDFLDLEFVENSKKIYNAELFTDDFEVTLKDDEYFMMGDNRLRSTDSRELGPFVIEDIIGINGVVLFPFSNIQWMN